MSAEIELDKRSSSRIASRKSLVEHKQSPHCIICCQDLDPSDNRLPGETTQRKIKIFSVLCYHLNATYTPGIWNLSEKTLPFCTSCTKAATTVLELHDQIEVLGVKLRILLEDICKDVIYTSKLEKELEFHYFGQGNKVTAFHEEVVSNVTFTGLEKANGTADINIISRVIPDKWFEKLHHPTVSIERSEGFTSLISHPCPTKSTVLLAQDERQYLGKCPKELKVKDKIAWYKTRKIVLKKLNSDPNYLNVNPGAQIFYPVVVIKEEPAEVYDTLEMVQDQVEDDSMLSFTEDHVKTEIQHFKPLTTTEMPETSSQSPSIPMGEESQLSDGEGVSIDSDCSWASDHEKRQLEKWGLKAPKRKRPIKSKPDDPLASDLEGKAYRNFFKSTTEGKLIHKEFEVLKVDGGFQCLTCSAVVETKAMAVDHIKLIHKGHSKVCQECGKQFSKPSSVLEHMKSVHNSERQLVTCETCEKPFKSQATLTRHTWSHMSQEEISALEAVGKINPWPLRNAHYKQKLLPCQYCGKLITKASMSAHEEKHTGSDRPFECRKCSVRRTYITEHDLKVHDRATHLVDPNQFQCHVCLKGFSTRRRLMKHSWTHTGEKPYLCATCGKGFRSNLQCRLHQVTHQEGVRPYKCAHCPATYRWSTSLIRHNVTCKGVGRVRPGLVQHEAFQLQPETAKDTPPSASLLNL